MKGTLIRELLKENESVQQDKMNHREIKYFADKIFEKDMNVLFLDMLRACCSCAGKGVAKNQTMVSECFFGTGQKHVFFDVEADFDNRITADGGFFPLSSAPSSPTHASPPKNRSSFQPMEIANVANDNQSDKEDRNISFGTFLFLLFYFYLFLNVFFVRVLTQSFFILNIFFRIQ